jgi:hypothetical protein
VDNPLALEQKDYPPIGPAQRPMLAAAGGAAALGLASPFLAPVLGRSLMSTGRAAGSLGKLWLGEKLLEELVPTEYQPSVVRALRVLGEAH